MKSVKRKVVLFLLATLSYLTYQLGRVVNANEEKQAMVALLNNHFVRRLYGRPCPRENAHHSLRFLILIQRSKDRRGLLN